MCNRNLSRSKRERFLYVFMKTRIEYEKRTVEKMIRLYCRDNRHAACLCEDCKQLLEYAHRRLELCRFGEKKTTCRKCPVHCYRRDMREKMQAVMRYAGPRMLFRYPLYAVKHFWMELF